MINTFARFRNVVFAAVILTSCLMVTSLSGAQETSGSGLRVSPTRSDVSIIPGDGREVIQRVKNVTQAPITVEPVLNDFESDNVSGEPQLIGDPEDVSAYSLREFITLPEPFDLAPEEEKELSVALNIPENAAPGAYFGSVIYRATPQGSRGDGQVALVASVGSLVLLEVPGDITEKIQINDVSAYLDDSSGSIFTKKPNKVGIEIENLGNGFSRPFGTVVVKDWRGNSIFDYELNDGPPRANILPRSTRIFFGDLLNVEEKTVNDESQVTTSSPITWPGRYEVTANISHGNSGEIFTVQTSFWYIPGWLIIVLVALLAALVFIAVYLYRKYVTKVMRRKK